MTSSTSWYQLTLHMPTPIGCLDTGRCLFGVAPAGGRGGATSETFDVGAPAVPLEASPVLDGGFFPESVAAYLEADDEWKCCSLSKAELEDVMGCRYCHHLVFERESELRSRDCWAYPPPVSPATPYGKLPSSEAAGCAELLRDGAFLFESLIVRRLGLVAGVDAGLGLFATGRGVASGEFLGEYTGVVRQRRAEDDDSYSYALPITDPDLVICAARFGNLSRLINHSDEAWNAELVGVHHEGVVHVVCRAVRDIAPGEQIFIHYGDRYWSATGRQRVDMPRYVKAESSP